MVDVEDGFPLLFLTHAFRTGHFTEILSSFSNNGSGVCGMVGVARAIYSVECPGEIVSSSLILCSPFCSLEFCKIRLFSSNHVGLEIDFSKLLQNIVIQNTLTVQPAGMYLL